MKTLTSLMAVMLAMLLMGAAFAQQPPDYIDVRDYGANGTDDNDDTTAIQAALDACVSGNYATRSVYIPSGKYYISQTLNLYSVSVDNNVKIFGAGRLRYGIYPAATSLYWSGASGGTMFDFNYVVGVRMHDLYIDGDAGEDGVNKAGTLINVRGACANFHLENLTLCNAVTGLKCNTGNCNSDMTFIEVGFKDMTTGFEALGNQNVNYVFIRCGVNRVDVGLSFNEGGTVSALNLGGSEVGTAIKIRNSAGGSGVYSFDCTKIESQFWNGARSVILDAGDSGAAASVTFTGLCTGVNGRGDHVTPAFKVGKGMQVTVIGSTLYAPRLADLVGVDQHSPAWITFDNCQFLETQGPDPRLTVTSNTYSGYEFRNCTSGKGLMKDCRKDSYQITPEPPTNVAVSIVDGNKIRVTWTDAAETATPPTAQAYKIDHRLENGTQNEWGWSQLGEQPQGMQTYTSTPRASGTYWVRVSTRTASGSNITAPSLEYQITVP